jgi:hypothetical protein
MKFITLKVREDDLIAVRDLMVERSKERKRLVLSQRYIDKIVKFLAANENMVLAKIKRNPKTAFHWNQLVTQELIMWADITKPVGKDEFKDMCRRRGFNRAQKQFLEDGLDLIGLKDW